MDIKTQTTLPIIYEDSAVLAINKPAGITVNKAESNATEYTVQDFLAKYLEKQLAGAEDLESDFVGRAGFVHRIDKETSGVLLAAKSEQVFTELQRQFKERIVKKEYIALVHGHMRPDTGEIRIPVGRLPWNRKQFGVMPGGKESVTLYAVETHYESQMGKEQFSLVRLNPETGRTHQIRVHLKYQGYPIFSDFLYAGRKTAVRDRKILNRVFLHAAKLSFVHPVTGKRLTLESPIPEELQQVLRALTVK